MGASRPEIARFGYRVSSMRLIGRAWKTETVRIVRSTTYSVFERNITSFCFSWSLIYRGSMIVEVERHCPFYDFLSYEIILNLRSTNPFLFPFFPSSFLSFFLSFFLDCKFLGFTRIEITGKNCNKRKDSELVAEKIATTSRVRSYRAFICHEIGHFHARCAILFSPIVRLRIGVNPLPSPFFPHRCSSPKDRRTRERFAPVNVQV